MSTFLVSFFEFQEMKNFLEYCRDVNQLDIDEDPTELLCVYFESLKNELNQFETMLDKLDADHPKIKPMRISFEHLHKLIAKGEQKSFQNKQNN